MRSFLFHLFLFALAPLAAVAAAVLNADGTTDAFYLRFTTPKASSMILGTSRAAQGIRPDALDSSLAASGWQVESFNYAFAKTWSNYGPAYIASVLRKLDRSRRDGAFVLSVDPWGLDMRPGDGDGAGWGENENLVARMRTVSMRPNLEYMLTIYDAPILTALLPGPEQRTGMVLHENGWLEVRIAMDSASVARRAMQKLDEYRASAQGSRLSPLRVACLQAMIDSLAPYGTVALVRLPVPAGMLAIENSIMPHFDAVMEGTAKAKGIQYLNFTHRPGSWIYTDGNHLAADDAGRMAAMIGDSLVNARREAASK